MSRRVSPKTDEVIALAKEAAKRGGIYDTHTRDYGSFTVGYANSYKEALDVGKEAGMRGAPFSLSS